MGGIIRTSAVAKVVTDDRLINQLQDNILAVLNPLLANKLVSGSILPSITLAVGTNHINHKLNRVLEGWFLVRKRAGGNIYDVQDANLTPKLTLDLVSDSIVTVDLYVF